MQKELTTVERFFVFYLMFWTFYTNTHPHTQLKINLKWRNSVCDKPGENVLAGIRICKGAELGDDNTVLSDGSHVRISFDKPKWERRCNRNHKSRQSISKYRQTKSFYKLCHIKGTEDKKLLLSVVGDLAVLEVKFVHEGLTIKKVVKGFVSDLKKPRTQTEETPLQKWRNPACKKANRQQIRLWIWHRCQEIMIVGRRADTPVTVAGTGSASSSHVSKIFL